MPAAVFTGGSRGRSSPVAILDVTSSGSDLTIGDARGPWEACRLGSGRSRVVIWTNEALLADSTRGWVLGE